MDNFEQIEKYIQNKMNADEKSTFELEMESNPDLKEEVNVLKDLVLGVESYGLKQKLSGRKIGQTSSSEEISKVVAMPKKKASPLRYLAVAASFAAVFFCGYWLLQPNTSYEKQLFADAFYTDPGLPTPMSETNNYNFYDAMVDYKMGKYEVALDKWENVRQGIGLDTLNFYKGMAFLNQGKLEEANEFLNQIDITSALQSSAKWHQLEILIKQEKYDAAIYLLKTIPESSNPYQGQILKYLKEK